MESLDVENSLTALENRITYLEANNGVIYIDNY